jgi:hypothetical protein
LRSKRTRARQLVEARLADEAADAGHARIVGRHQLAGVGVGLVGIHRTELVDLDQLVVEAVALLLEQHRAAAVELDGDGDDRHDRERGEKRQRSDDLVE